MHGKLDGRIMSELILNNASDLFLHYFPEASTEVTQAEMVYYDLFDEMQRYYEEVRGEMDGGLFKLKLCCCCLLLF
jgi:hypothetical protein